MERSKRIIFISHCILNQNTVVHPLARSKGAYRQIIETIMDEGIGIHQLPWNKVLDICSILDEINNVLLVANLNVGYRIRDEICFYIINNSKYGLLDEKVAMDNEILQKILPRIQGSTVLIKTMLCELFKICAGDYSGYQTQTNNLKETG